MIKGQCDVNAGAHMHYPSHSPAAEPCECPSPSLGPLAAAQRISADVKNLLFFLSLSLSPSLFHSLSLRLALLFPLPPASVWLNALTVITIFVSPPLFFFHACYTMQMMSLQLHSCLCGSPFLSSPGIPATDSDTIQEAIVSSVCARTCMPCECEHAVGQRCLCTLYIYCHVYGHICARLASIDNCGWMTECVYRLLPEATFSLWIQRCEFPAFLRKTKGSWFMASRWSTDRKRCGAVMLKAPFLGWEVTFNQTPLEVRKVCLLDEC